MCAWLFQATPCVRARFPSLGPRKWRSWMYWKECISTFFHGWVNLEFQTTGLQTNPSKAETFHSQDKRGEISHVFNKNRGLSNNPFCRRRRHFVVYPRAASKLQCLFFLQRGTWRDLIPLQNEVSQSSCWGRGGSEGSNIWYLRPWKANGSGNVRQSASKCAKHVSMHHEHCRAETRTPCLPIDLPYMFKSALPGNCRPIPKYRRLPESICDFSGSEKNLIQEACGYPFRHLWLHCKNNPKVQCRLWKENWVFVLLCGNFWFWICLSIFFQTRSQLKSLILMSFPGRLWPLMAPYQGFSPHQRKQTIQAKPCYFLYLFVPY